MSRYFLSFLIIAGWLLSSSADAQAPAPEENPKPYLVRDINAHTSTYNKPLELMEAGPVSYFFGSGGQGVFGLWKTDGTEAETSFVKAIDFGRTYSSAYTTASGMLGGYLFFGASELGEAAETHGTELWRTDGTAQGTSLVADLIPGAESSLPNGFVLMSGKLYFIGGWALWRLDGPDAQPVHVWGEIYGGNTQILNRSPLFVLGDRLYFSASAQDVGAEMWVSDGTPAGTHPLVDLNPGATSSFAFPLLAQGGVLYFSADAGGKGKELWVYDPATGETKIVADINPSGSSNPDMLQAMDDIIFFSARAPETGYELYSLKDGGVQLVIDLSPGPGSSYLILYGIIDTPQGKRLLFKLDDGSVLSGLYITDGTEGGTLRILDFEYPFDSAGGQKTASPGKGEAQPFQATSYYQGYFYFENYTREHGIELWRTDGTVPGTQLFKDIWPGYNHGNPHNFRRCGTRLCFVADDGDHGYELWTTDGSPAGTALVADLNTDPPGSDSSVLTPANGLVYFLAQDGTNGLDGNSLWCTDGTEAGTMRLMSSKPGEGIRISYLIAAGSRAYFTMEDRAHGRELWYSDGTPETTRMLEDIYPGQTGSNPILLGVLGDTLFFTAEHPKLGRELWITGGTPAGTRMIADLSPGMEDTYIDLAYPYRQQLLFILLPEDKSEYSLWTTDGTAQGTMQVTAIQEPRGRQPFVQAHGLVYLFTNSPTETILWQTDGTQQGTRQVPYPDCVAKDGWAYGMAEMNGALYFIQTDWSPPTYPNIPFTLMRKMDAQSPLECVWSTSVLLEEGMKIELMKPVVHGGHLIFNVPGPGPDVQQLMISDGTAAGTTAFPGQVDQLANVFSAGPYLYFRGSSSGAGEELWVLSNDMQSSSMVMDINPGAGSSSPGKFAYSNRNGLLFFTADDGKHGEELWAYSVPAKRLILPLIGR